MRLLKFDLIHPLDYLRKKKAEWKDIDDLSLEEYRDRLIGLRSNYSDFYTYHLKGHGWEAEEYFLNDAHFEDKVAAKVYGATLKKEKVKNWLMNKRGRDPLRWRKKVISAYIAWYQPDVIFIRSQPLPSGFWSKFRHKGILVVGRLSARLPFHWHPNHFDLLYTDQPDFQKFFELHGVKTIMNKQGFDQRILSELEAKPYRYDVTFAGGLGKQNFSKRTEFFNQIAQRIEDFQWWGYWFDELGANDKLTDYPALAKSHHGITSGLEMFQIFRDSKINLNDYVDTANGIGFNQRMFEVMGSGGFLLTREASNFKEIFPDDIFATYSSTEECIEKIRYYLAHPAEREELAQRAQAFIAEHYDYKEIVADFSNDLKSMLKK